VDPRAVEARGDVVLEVVDGGVVALDVRHDVLDRVLVRGREVDVAAPDPGPRPLRHVVVDREWLRVVDDRDVPVAVELARVHLVVALKHLPLLGAERVGVSLERVVEPLGDVVELLAAEHHLPLGLDPDILHQRDQGVEDLRYAAAEGGRGDVHHAQALEALRQLPDLGDQLAPREVRVVSEALVPYGNGLKHGGADYCGPGPGSRAARRLTSSVRSPP
jgi:hypothetical protein